MRKEMSFLSLAFLAIIIIVFASPSADVQSPSEPDNAYLNRNYTFINISTNITNVDTVLVEWNNTNITIDDSALIANFHFNENTSAQGGVNDSGRFRHNATAIGSPYFNASGRFGNAWSFNGASNFVQTSAFIISQSQGKTGCGWIYASSYGSLVSLIRKSGDISIRFQSNGSIQDRIYNSTGTSVVIQSSFGISTNQWHHVCMIWISPGAGQNLIIQYYLDGVLRDNITTSVTDSAGLVGTAQSGNLTIGNDPDAASRFFKGSIDEVRIWNRALSVEEMNATYKAELGRHNATQFFFNTTDLAEGTYTWQGIINSTTGESNRTARRTVTIDANPASEYATGMDADNVYLNRNYTFINISTGGNIDTVKIEWNGTNATIDDPTLVLNMHFEENDTTWGGIKDSSRYGRNFTINTTSNSMFTANGKFGSANAFDAIDDYMNATYNPQTPVGTVMAWIKYPLDNATRKAKVIFSVADVNDIWRYFLFYINGSLGAYQLQAYVEINGSTRWTLLTDGNLANDTWYHVAVVQNGTEPVLYVNGVAVAQHFGGTIPAKGDWWNKIMQPTVACIGCSSGVSTNIGPYYAFFNGTIDELRVYERNLSASEMAASYAATMGRYNATQFYFNTTDLIDGPKSYSIYLNDTAGETKRFANRAVNIDRICSPPDAANWAISTMCSFTGRALSTAFNLTLQNGGNITLINSNISFTGANPYIMINSGSELDVNSGSNVG